MRGSQGVLAVPKHTPPRETSARRTRMARRTAHDGNGTAAAVRRSLSAPVVTANEPLHGFAFAVVGKVPFHVDRKRGDTDVTASCDARCEARQPQCGSRAMEGRPVMRSQMAAASIATALLVSMGAFAGIGDTLWTAELPASGGDAVIPGSVWSGRADTTAVLNVWHMGLATGEGFEGELVMVAGLGARTLIRVSPPGTPANLARSPLGGDAVR